MTGVDWFGYGRREQTEAHDSELRDQDEIAPAWSPALAGMIEGTKLPADAELIAIKAEQHYIQIWSRQGKDLVRFRFKDLNKVLDDTSGMQVHRSWWANLNCTEETHIDGRKFELLMAGGVTVPVSLAYKSAVLNQLKAVEGANS